MATSLRQLQALLDFTDTDLNANRRGRLSKSQVKVLESSANQELIALLFIPTLVLIWILLSVRLTVSLPVLLVVGLLMAGLVALHQNHLETLKSKSIYKLSGYLSKSPVGGKYGYLHYVISIDGQQLPVERDLYEQLSEGKFILYMLPDSNEILCMEPLRNRSTTAAQKSNKTGAKRRKTTAKSTSRQRTTGPKSSKSRQSQTKPKLAKAKGGVKALPLTRTRQTAKATKRTPTR